jgi:nucleoside-diphosphate-sugar epimerase
MAENILVTGAGGFIGSHLTDYLLEEGVSKNNLRLFVWNKADDLNIRHEDLQIIKGDIRDKRAVKKAMENINVVFHLAAKIDFEGKTYDEYKSVNVEGTQNLLDECERDKTSKFVFVSSIGVYGLPADIGDINGWDEEHPKNYTNYYGKSKYEAEKCVIRTAGNKGFPYSIIRPASVYGPREKGPTLALYRAIKNHTFMLVGNGENLMHYVFVRDLVEGIRQAQLSKKSEGDYILAGARPTKYKDVVKYVANSVNENTTSFIIPKWLALAVSYPIKYLSVAVGKEPILFPSRVKTMTTTYYYDISKAKKELDYNPKTTFKEGSKVTGRWYLENGYL